MWGLVGCPFSLTTYMCIVEFWRGCWDACKSGVQLLAVIALSWILAQAVAEPYMYLGLQDAIFQCMVAIVIGLVAIRSLGTRMYVNALT